MVQYNILYCNGRITNAQVQLLPQEGAKEPIWSHRHTSCVFARARACACVIFELSLSGVITTQLR